MTDKDSNFTQNGQDGVSIEKTEHEKAVKFSRRRLIKIGAATVPVALTLASRPALAWHCRAPSIWGSMNATGGATSLAAHADHTTTQYRDETWTITNWKNNESYNAVSISEKNPWAALNAKYSLTGRKALNKDSTLDKLKNKTGFGPGGAETVSSYLNSAANASYNGTGDDYFNEYMLVALLNWTILSTSDLQTNCLTMDELKSMATGSFTTNGVTWGPDLIKKYLWKNWIVVPNNSSKPAYPDTY